MTRPSMPLSKESCATEHSNPEPTNLGSWFDDWFVLVQHSIVIFLSGLVLDGGRLFQTVIYATAAYWVGALIIMFRRGPDYTRADWILLRWGYIPLCIISGYLTHWIWHLRGH